MIVLALMVMLVLWMGVVMMRTGVAARMMLVHGRGTLRLLLMMLRVCALLRVRGHRDGGSADLGRTRLSAAATTCLCTLIVSLRLGGGNEHVARRRRRRHVRMLLPVHVMRTLRSLRDGSTRMNDGGGTAVTIAVSALMVSALRMILMILLLMHHLVPLCMCCVGSRRVPSSHAG